MNNGVYINDVDNYSICNADEIVWCQDATACNYNEYAIDARSYVLASSDCDTYSSLTDRSGIVVDGDADNDRTCDADEVCNVSGSLNYGYLGDCVPTYDDAVDVIEDSECSRIYPTYIGFINDYNDRRLTKENVISIIDSALPTITDICTKTSRAATGGHHR